MSAYAPHKYNPWEMPEEELEATFIGRQAMLNRLLEAVREQNQAASIQHYVLLGPRGIGKTTLLLLLRRRLKKDAELAARWLCVHYREEEFYVYTLRDLLALALESLYADEGIAEAKPVLDEAQADTDDERSQAILLAGLRRISEARGQRFLLLVDNLDQFLRGLPKRDETETFQHALRKLLSTEHFLMLIGTSTRHFEEIYPYAEPIVHTGPIASYDEALFNFFCPLTVGSLSDDEVDALLLARAGFDDNREFIQDYEQHKANVRTITFLTGGNPRLVLMLYEILSQHRVLPVVQALRQTVDNLTPLFKDVLEQMSRQQSKTLDAIMRLGGAGSPSDIASTARLALNVVTTMLGRLRDAGFLASEGEGKGHPATYRVRDQMFRTWYQMRYLRPARRRVELFVEFLRAWFASAERETSLDRLHGEFKQELTAGLLRHARETAYTMEYYAASLEDGDARKRELERVADAYAAADDLHQAALTLADVEGVAAESDARYEAAGYLRLGFRLSEKGDLEQASRAYTEALRGAPAEHAAMAMFSRGIIKGRRGDIAGEIADYTGAIELPDSPVEQVAKALINRGVVRGMQGDREGEVGDYTRVIELEFAAADHVAQALFNRGVAKRMRGDLEGALADYSAVVEMAGAPPDQVAKALFNRGVAKGMRGDWEGALADYTAVVEMAGAPPDQVAQALVNRGAANGMRGDLEGALADFQWVIELPGAPAEQAARALFNRAVTKSMQGHAADAIADLSRCVESGASAEAVRRGIGGLVGLLAALGRSEEALRWVSRMDELEPPGTPTDERLEGRISVLREVAGRLSIDVAGEALALMFKTPNAELREKLAFLVPALELARTGDEGVLAKLPEAEREAARRIAATLAKSRQEG